MAKDIEVATVVPGQAAVATYYAEGSLQAKGAAAVSNYLTRVTLVFVKERRRMEAAGRTLVAHRGRRWNHPNRD